ncbi:O-antigen ligase family protein [Fontimonas sp. SYSU GA230001]|uniref:O-antigen ligase family protein n=1 Tax=Fontimonas sp. SYSU GA230001 TaxID=3142450 RepID=UPI0032B4551C
MLLIASGPPMLRDERRGALASLQGQIDAWILWQLAVYALAGGLALLYLAGPLRRGVHRRNGPLLALSGFLCLLFATSSLWSPSIVATLSMSLLLGLAMLVTAQFASTGARLDHGALDLLGALRLLAGVLMGLVMLAYLTDQRGIVQWVPTGIRVRGGRLGVQQTLGPTVFVISLYFLAFGLRNRATELFWIAFSLAAVWMARTRAAYVTVAIGALGVWVLWIRTHPERRRLMQKLLLTSIVASILLALVAAFSGLLQATWYRGGSADSVTTLSHRTTVWSWTFREIAERPWGFGYSTGFRNMFLNIDAVTSDAYRYEGLLVERIGEAHNSHLEVLVAAGWTGFAIYLGILGIVVHRGVRVLRMRGISAELRHGARVAMILLAMFMVDGMTTSSYALPTRQPFGILLFVIGLVLIIEARASVRAPRPLSLVETPPDAPDPQRDASAAARSA